MGQEPGAGATQWEDWAGQRAEGWAEAVHGDTSADGADGESVCVLGEGERGEEGVAGNPWRGCCGPQLKVMRG